MQQQKKTIDKLYEWRRHNTQWQEYGVVKLSNRFLYSDNRLKLIVLLQPLEWHVPIITEQSLSIRWQMCAFIRVSLILEFMSCFKLNSICAGYCSVPLFWWINLPTSVVSSTPIQLTRQDCSVWSMCTEIVLAGHAGFQVSYSRHWSGSHWVCWTHFVTPYPHLQLYISYFLKMSLPARKKTLCNIRNP